MSILDDLIARARRKEQDKQRTKLERDARKIRRIIGKDLYATLEITPNEYEGVHQFTARGKTFYISGPMVGWGMYVCPSHEYHRAFGDVKFVCSTDELLLFIDNRTRRGA